MAIYGSKWTGGITKGADALRRRRDVCGQILRFPAGETIVQDNGGGIAIKNRHGQIIKTISRFEAETHYAWNDLNELTRVCLPQGQVYEKSEDKTWTKIAGDGSFAFTDNEFTVLEDGTLRISFRSPSGHRLHRDLRLDGSTLVANERGRIIELQTDLSVQRDRLYSILDTLRRDNLISCRQRQLMCDAYHALQRRVFLEEISSDKAAQSVFHINRLLETCGFSPLGSRLCFVLACEIMYFTALPDEAETRDGLSVLIQRLFRNHPEQAAMLVADMSINKRYITGSGLTVPYVEELMHPLTRLNREWHAEGENRFPETSRFVRVVLVNVVEKIRMSARDNQTANFDEPRPPISTREFGTIFTHELDCLYEHVTGISTSGQNHLRQGKRFDSGDACAINGLPGNNVFGGYGQLQIGPSRGSV